MTPRVPGPWPSRDPGVYARPGASSVRQAALWDAIYELAIGNMVGITPEGAQGLIDQSIGAHERAPDPHPVYVTVPEGDLRWGGSSGLSPHTHLADTSGGVIDYLRTQWGADHLSAPDPHPAYATGPEVEALVDQALVDHASEPDPHPVYLTQAEGDVRYLPVTYTPPPVDAYTKGESDARYPLKTAPDPYPQYLTQGEADLRYQVIGAYLTQATGDARYLQLTGGAVSGALSVQGRPVGLSAVAGNTLLWNSGGVYSDAPTRAQYDALVARVAALEGKTVNIENHYHPMGTWRQTSKMVVPASQPAGVAA